MWNLKFEMPAITTRLTPEPGWELVSEAAPAVSSCEQSDRDSRRPFATNVVAGGIRTFRGIKYTFAKPNGSYSFVDQAALEQRRMARVEKFEAMVSASVETELFFEDTFSKQEWAAPPESGVQVKQHVTKINVGVGT